jgi:hypothetical protein
MTVKQFESISRGITVACAQGYFHYYRHYAYYYYCYIYCAF